MTYQNERWRVEPERGTPNACDGVKPDAWVDRIFAGPRSTGHQFPNKTMKEHTKLLNTNLKIINDESRQRGVHGL